MNSLYDVTARAIINGPSLFDLPPALDADGAVIYTVIEVPCRHRWWTRLRDRLRGEPHESTHEIMEPIVRVALLDARPSEGIEIKWDASGRLVIE